MNNNESEFRMSHPESQETESGLQKNHLEWVKNKVDHLLRSGKFFKISAGALHLMVGGIVAVDAIQNPDHFSAAVAVNEVLLIGDLLGQALDIAAST